MLVALVVALFLVQIPAVQGGIVGGLVGLLTSQLTTWMQRSLRERGEVDCEVAELARSMTSSQTVSYSFRVRFFNNKDVAVGLWHLRVVFPSQDGQEEPFTPMVLGTGTPSMFSELDLPSRVSVSRTLEITSETTLLPGLIVGLLDNPRKAELRGVFTGGTPFVADLPIHRKEFYGDG